MGQLEDMALFIRIVEAGGISKASEQLNLAKSAVSRRLSELEESLKAPLLIRTTRKWRLTDTGETYYQKAKKIVDDVSHLNAEISGKPEKLEGKLTMSAPLSFGLIYLGKVIDDFCSIHPDLTINIDLTDRQVDIIEEGYELAIRISDLKDSRLRAKKINAVGHSLVASPEYIKQHGKPLYPQDVEGHAFLRYNLSAQTTIQLYDSQDKKISITTLNKIESNNADYLKEMAIRGYGISYLPTFLVYDALCESTLVRVLPEYSLPTLSINAVYPNNRFLSQKARAFIDFLFEHCSKQPYWMGGD